MKSKFPLDFPGGTSSLPAHFTSISPPRIPMVVIRLRREGTKNRPYYRVVAADQRFRTTGRFLELLGTYDPVKEGDNFDLKLEQIDAWIAKGAQPSETVASLIKKARKKVAATA
jgi:small subunit ribosomal protein S16